MRLSNEDLYKIIPPSSRCLKLQLPLVCQVVHNRYGSMIASHLLSQETRWNPPELIIDEATTSSVNWLQDSADRIGSRLTKVDIGTIKVCCDLYLSPESTPKSKSAKYTVVAGHFRSRSIFLFSLTDIEFFEHYFALFPSNQSPLESPRRQLVEEMLKEEFGHEISNQLLLPPSSERKNGKKRQIRREQHLSSIVGAHEVQDEYVRSWPQPVPKQLVLKCINAYHNATQLKLPPACCVCARQQMDIEVHYILLRATD
jgi:hypothetical protein